MSDILKVENLEVEFTTQTGTVRVVLLACFVSRRSTLNPYRDSFVTSLRDLAL